MAYTGKKPVDHTDVTQSQSMTVTDDLTVDTNTLYVDSTNNRVGIGTTSPTRNLHVNSGTGDVVARFESTDADAYVNFVSSGGEALVGSSGNDLVMYPAGTERMRITSAGRVGIGTTSPAQLLHLRSATPAIEFDDSGFSTVRGRIYSDEGNLLLEADYNSARNSSNIEMKVDNLSRFRIESNGRVRVGSSSTDTNAAFEVNNISYYLYPIYRLSSDTYNPRFAVFKRASGTEVGSIRFTTSPYTGVTYNTTSDYRLKENVVGITDGITRVKQLNPSRFNFIGEPDGTIDGFLAHEVSPAVPEAVSGTHNETRPIGDITDTDGNVIVSDTQEPPELQDGQTWTETGTEPVYQEIDHSRLVPLLTAALQEAITKIEDLEARVATLEGN